MTTEEGPAHKVFMQFTSSAEQLWILFAINQYDKSPEHDHFMPTQTVRQSAEFTLRGEYRRLMIRENISQIVQLHNRRRFIWGSILKHKHWKDGSSTPPAVDTIN